MNTGTRTEVAVSGKQDMNPPQLTFYQKHEVPRKIFHCLTGVFTVWLFVNGFSQKHLTFYILTMTVVCMTQEALRFSFPRVNQFVVDTYGFMMRDCERTSVNGILYYLLGLLMLCLCMPKDITLLAIFFLSWGDTAALFVGRELGRYTPSITKSKSLAGCLANFAVALTSCYLFYGVLVPRYSQFPECMDDIYYSPHLSRLGLGVLSVLGGLVSSIAESIEVLDDNITIPVVSSIFMYTIVTLAK